MGFDGKEATAIRIEHGRTSGMNDRTLFMYTFLQITNKTNNMTNGSASLHPMNSVFQVKKYRISVVCYFESA